MTKYQKEDLVSTLKEKTKCSVNSAAKKYYIPNPRYMTI